MTRALPLLILLAPACDPEPEPDLVRTVVATTSSPTTDPMGTHRVLWQVDGGAPVERDVFDDAVYLHTAAGTGCSPTALVIASGVQLHFPDLPVPDLVAPLPAAVQRDVNDPFAPYFVPLSVGGQAILGGTVRVVTFDARRWVFRFEGEGLANCVPTSEPCTPIPDGTLTIEPLGSGTMPGLSGPPCIDAGPFPWPDGWDGCAVPSSVPSSDGDGAIYQAGTCPSPMPW